MPRPLKKRTEGDTEGIDGNFPSQQTMYNGEIHIEVSIVEPSSANGIYLVYSCVQKA